MIQHLAIIMDGNRRWAKQRALRPWLGHDAGVESVKKSVRFCKEQKIPYLSLYAFSLENFKRPQMEQEYLFDIFATHIKDSLLQLVQEGVKIVFIGERKLFPDRLVPLIEEIEEKTKLGNALTLAILFCYGGRQEIVHGIKQIVDAVKQGKLVLENLTDENVKDYLWSHELPDPDLIIRTGGQKRLSNFYLYQSAYSELYFTDCLWPDLGERELHQALDEYTQRKRNFGQ